MLRQTLNYAIHAKNAMQNRVTYAAHWTQQKIGIAIPERLFPQRPAGATSTHLHGLPLYSRQYDLLSHPISGLHPRFTVPDTWHPAPTGPLEQQLPYAWDARYNAFQPFQPVKLWRNAVALALYIETAPKDRHARAARSVLYNLLDRLAEYTVWDGDCAYVENRFTPLDQTHTLPWPWVGAISNAFAILACHRLSKVVGTRTLALSYARPFLHIYNSRNKPPERWVSVRDQHGYLWFDEYPRPQGRTSRVKNGHLFALFALHAMHLRHPDVGFEPLIHAGATTIDAYARVLRCPGQISRYAANWRSRHDYLPGRAVRQLYQLYELTGSRDAFRNGDLFFADMDRFMDENYRLHAQRTREHAIRVRAALGEKHPVPDQSPP